MATRLTNPFDSDRAGRVTPVTECTPAVATLLTPTQPQQSMEADAADMDNIDSWQWDLEPAEPEEARPSQSNTSAQCAADEPSAAQLPTSAVATQPDPVATGTVSHEKPAGTSRTSSSMKQAVKSELDARLSNLAMEARQKKKKKRAFAPHEVNAGPIKEKGCRARAGGGKPSGKEGSSRA
ncbi:hypothetical protein MTO96_028258 [Rhipicephalus appendiculatus]